jgi:YfiH family protein
LRQIDAAFAAGGLKHGKHRKSSPEAGNSGIGTDGRRDKNIQPPRARSAEKTPVVLQVPEWGQYDWLVHGFSTRIGGISGVYQPGARCGDLNLGFTAADSRENVEKNRELFLNAVLQTDRPQVRVKTPAKSQRVSLQSSRQTLQLFRQIHSGLLHCVTQDHPAKDRDSLLRGDGAIANETGTLLGIQTADCIPVLVADVRQRIVAAFHAGWRGTLARIVERGVGRMRAEFRSRPGDLTAAIGPGIGRCCYSVGEEVRSEFRSQFHYADALFEEVFDLDPIKEKYPMLFLTARAPGHGNLGPSLHLDLMEANRRQLLDAGIGSQAIHVLGLCTSCDTKRFFSHRAEQGFTGRMISVIGVAR